MFSMEFWVTSLVVVLVPGTGVIYTVSTGLFKGWRGIHPPYILGKLQWFHFTNQKLKKSTTSPISTLAILTAYDTLTKYFPTG